MEVVLYDWLNPSPDQVTPGHCNLGYSDPRSLYIRTPGSSDTVTGGGTAEHSSRFSSCGTVLELPLWHQIRIDAAKEGKSQTRHWPDFHGAIIVLSVIIIILKMLYAYVPSKTISITQISTQLDYKGNIEFIQIPTMLRLGKADGNGILIKLLRILHVLLLLGTTARTCTVWNSEHISVWNVLKTTKR